MDVAVTLNDIRKTFGTHRAVDGLSFEIPRGTVFGLLGRNGAGKSTTIRMIMDIIRPDSGSIEILGRPMDGLIKDRLGYLPEERGLYPKMKVLDMLEFFGSVKGLKPAEARRRGLPWLERLELAEWKDKKVEELSKGMQQKAQFITTILNEPDVLILDEPFSGMDPVNQEIFRNLLLEITQSGTTLIFSTHVMESAERLCNQIALIDHGRAVLSGSLASIKRKFGSNTVQLEFDGDGRFLETLPGVAKVHRSKRFVEVNMNDGEDPQGVLEAAAGRLAVRRFEVMEPTLHNIFIDQVGPESEQPTDGGEKEY
ncbi:MAG: ATP-binding cassette domain-containing protein, partial [Acidobacteria bacterium]|nr:ATP-binding cassette domain-containing protein [Acidobacteriota bacterium]NIM63752.1 ATP-binding cassette domain-containing protein [Acidobacteriota bacterium]NIO59321.1 ATP-binding cassette domain-containing protein [Acidobacteriota bacterium]NIQ30335.1 ATP-binding cassette domain-containing protein [Acidobacteriota bacterium]NIQ85272.1 ATP-binding cassette domain-containing protein [Acidobacteriota bacterium]